MSRVIWVEQYHIDRGEQGICGGCPVALAISVVLKDGFRVSVGHRTFAIHKIPNVGKKPTYREDLPPEVSDRIRLYDFSGKMEPFDFMVDIPAEFQN